MQTRTLGQNLEGSALGIRLTKGTAPDYPRTLNALRAIDGPIPHREVFGYWKAQAAKWRVAAAWPDFICRTSGTHGTFLHSHRRNFGATA